MKVFVKGKESFDKLMQAKGITDDNVETFSKTFFISIYETKLWDGWEFYFKQNHSNVLVLRFDDCDENLEVTFFDGRPSEWIYAMSEEQAKRIIDFIEANKDKDNCIVHCAAGISRSGAVATFINDLYGDSYDEFRKTNPYIHPNSHVLSTLRKVFNSGLNVQECDAREAK